MLKVLLVDDNKSVLDGLKYLIDWEACGYMISASARSGDEAIEKAEKMDIDLVITDIRMPQMTGLELIAKMRERKPNLKFILISSYSEFDYAKWAIDNQVNGYLLKPIEEDELIVLLDSIRKDIYIKHQERDKKINYYVNNLFAGNHVIDDEYKKYFDGKSRYLMICQKCDEINDLNEYDSEISDMIYKAIQDFAEIKGEFIIKNSVGETEILIVPDKFNIEVFAKKLSEHIWQTVEKSFYIFVGKSVDEAYIISESKKSITELFPLVFYTISQNVFIYGERYPVFEKSVSDKTIIEKIVSHISMGEYEAATSKIAIFGKIVKEENVSPDSVILYVQNILFELNTILALDSEIFQKYTKRLTEICKQKLLNFQMLISFLDETAQELCEMILKIQKISKMGIVGKAIEHVENNYGDKGLKLQKIANMYFVNPAYFGQVFKQKTGKSFNTYITEKRIEKAKLLLKNTNMRLYEIADSVGFSDPNYFSNKFSEIEGMSPTVYREKNRKE